MSKEIKVGVFGCSRGLHYASLMNEEDAIEVVAFCDKLEDRLNNAHKTIPDAACFADFDEFIGWGRMNGMNTVFLANYFHEHTPFAIKAMEAGMAVVTECIPAATLKQCVELVRAAERTGAKYMFGENYPFMVGNMELRRICKTGKLGTVMYLEAEYNHHDSPGEMIGRCGDIFHWRRWEPRAYYLTHTLCPLMYMVDGMPQYVSAMSAYSELQAKDYTFRAIKDGMAQMLCKFDNGSVARFSGCNSIASGYSCYRAFGDRGSAEWGGTVPSGTVRVNYKHFTTPEGESDLQMYAPVLSEIDPRLAAGQRAGHGGSDYMVVQNMIAFLRDGETPYFDVYKAAAISATAVYAHRSCLNNGQSYRIPDFRNEDERKLVENDDLSPFPDDEGNGVTIAPCVDFDYSYLENRRKEFAQRKENEGK